MDKKTYEKTRYQNIFRHKKNKNYVILMSKPIKTSISRIDGKKIFNIEEALKIRDNPKIKLQKARESIHLDDFETLWDKYINNCINIEKQAYNTINKKNKLYKKFFKNKVDKPINKTNKEYWNKFVNDTDTTLKQKNEIIKNLKAFFSWCIKEKIIIENPFDNIKKYKVPKPNMKYWTPEQLKKFLSTVELDITSKDINIRKKAYLIKTFTILTFSLGDRVGETRALFFKSINEELFSMSIRHSINYDLKSADFVSSTKTYESERDVDISEKTIQVIKEYRHFLEVELNFNITEDTLIFFNHSLQRPYSDVTIRKHFYYYCDKAKVPKIRMYDLRHTYAATMMSEGREAYLFSKRMGHKNISTTINVYGHLSNQVRKELAQTTDKYL